MRILGSDLVCFDALSGLSSGKHSREVLVEETFDVGVVLPELEGK